MGIGIVYKRVPDTVKGEDVMFWYSLFSLVLLLPAEFYSGSVSATRFPWIICLLLIGNFNIFGMLLLQTAMKRGNSGIAWALTQSALIGPFLFGMVFFGEKHSLLGITGLCLVLLGMICQIKDERKTPGAAPGRMHSLLLCFLRFSLLRGHTDSLDHLQLFRHPDERNPAKRSCLCSALLPDF